MKKVRIELLDALVGRRKLFDGVYKTFLTLICQLEEKYGEGASGQLFRLEKDMNMMGIGIQELIDEVDDIL